MNLIKNVIQNQFKTLSLISVALVFSGISLLVRIKLNKSFFYLFLIWNVFLAIIPYAITMYLSTKKNVSKLTLVFGFLVWLAFLPNAPYIVTDLIHIRAGNNAFLWLDILVVLSFALSGLLLFYLSVIDMQNLVASKFEKLPIKTITAVILFLCGFGVYLGRFLRYNSWEIISGPHILFKDIINIIIAPFQHYEAWLFTTGFGLFLVVGFWMFKNLNTLENN
ncbi:DUF1361 domain-containing protein [Winogradskyella eckloniae]|uniref:DUF1361 domain-containing protein n=1 Tax=Winogradskyella eckloniae TaxID=1089306 RepID=UPI001563E64C|nr:DUF1361 domain-containing protein [Winogradskyella eckloniae]NRD20724.1 DUF1361 domain-containing protein [Winogradskyella eckloniae]